MSGWLAALLGGLAVVTVGWRRRPLERPRDSGPAERLGRPRLAMAVVLAAGLGSLAVAAGVSIQATGAALVLCALIVVVRRRQSRAQLIERRRAAVVDLTYAVSGELRAGRGPVDAVRLTAPTAAAVDPQLLAAVVRDLSDTNDAAFSGLSFSDASALPGAERLRFLAAALGVAQSSGGRVVAVLERLGAAMDADEELRQELDAALAGPRASMVLLAGLPVLGIGLGQAMGAAPLRVLLHRPLGWGLLAAGTLLDLAGVVLVRLITRSALRC